MGVTIKDIARIVGVSYSTVAKALNDSPLVKPITKKKVMLTAKQLGYQPNFAAKSLVSKKSNVIGVVWPTIERAALSSLVTQINKELENHNYDMLLSIHPPHDAVALFERIQVDGILIFAEHESMVVGQTVLSSKIPIISIGKSQLIAAPVMDMNRKQAIKLAVQKLVEKGHTQLAYIGDLSNTSSNQWEKHSGFLEAIVKYNLPTTPFMTINTGGLEWHHGYSAAKKLISSPYKPTSIISGSYELTSGIVRALQEASFHIPLDLALISYDNIPHMEQLEIPVSAVGVSIELMADKIVRALVQLIEEPRSLPALTTLAAEYIQRKSS